MFLFSLQTISGLRRAERERERERRWASIDRAPVWQPTLCRSIHGEFPSLRSTLQYNPPPISLRSTQNWTRPRPTQDRARSSSNAQSTDKSSLPASSSPPFFLVQTQPKTQKNPFLKPTSTNPPLQRTHSANPFLKPPLATANLSLSIT